MKFAIVEDCLVVELASETETDAFGGILAQDVAPNDVIGLIGGLGAGKTRLTRGFAEALGVDSSAISSPTFVLTNEYEGRLRIYHFDAYRLSGPDDFDALGAAESFESGGVCIVEWADLVLDRLPREARLIRIDVTGPNSRVATLKGPGLDRLAKILTEAQSRDSGSPRYPAGRDIEWIHSDNDEPSD